MLVEGHPHLLDKIEGNQARELGDAIFAVHRYLVLADRSDR